MRTGKKSGAKGVRGRRRAQAPPIDDGVRLRALRMLLDLAISSKPRPLALSGKEAALVDAIRRGASPSAICNELAISIDDLLSSLWRLSRLPESRADAA